MINHTSIKETKPQNGLRVAIHEPLKGDTQTSEVAAPFGVDANPYPGIKGIFARATSAGRGVVLAFINRFLAAQPGEIRIYSTDDQGNDVVSFMHFKNNGTISINGDTTHEGDLTVNGGLEVNGDLDVNDGDITVTNGDVTADGISLKNHTHNYTDDGLPAVTDPPN